MSKTAYEVAVKSVGWFVLLDQVRKQATDAEDALLADSVRQFGILQPLGARQDGKLVWGHRRLRAAIAAGLKDVPVVILQKDMAGGRRGFSYVQGAFGSARFALDEELKSRGMIDE